MIDIGNVVAVIAASFGLGVFWYEFLRRPQKDRFRVTAISLVGVLIGEGLVSSGMVGGPAAYGLHPVTALVASFAAVYLHTAWAEKKVRPWEIIGELSTIMGPIKSVPSMRRSTAPTEINADAQAPSAARGKKAA